MWERDGFLKEPQETTATHYRHIGLYAYRAAFILRYSQWDHCPIEQQESLEQLRILWHGEKIIVAKATEAPPLGIDTPEDLERIRKDWIYSASQ